MSYLLLFCLLFNVFSIYSQNDSNSTISSTNDINSDVISILNFDITKVMFIGMF